MVRVFIASNLPTAYPYKLQKPSTLNDAVRDSADVFIMDSGIGDDDLSNADVLDLAHEYAAEYVIAKDYLHDQPKTTQSIREFARLYPEHPCDATPMVPLQPPHAEHYLAVCDLPFDHYVLGGMSTDSVTNDDIMQYIRRFNRVSNGEYTHALGIGGGRNLLSRLHGTRLIDSLDCATPEMAAANGRVMGKDLRQTEVRIMNGEGARKRNLPLAEFNSWQVHDAWNGGRDIEGQRTLPTA